MIESELPHKALVFRVSRLARLFKESLVASRGARGKWAMCRCLAGWIRTRLGCPGKPLEVTLRLQDLLIDVDIFQNEILPYWEIWYENSYELLPQFRAAEDACVVDVGGNVGFYAIRQALRATAGRVLVFEPSPNVFRRLRRNLEGNRFSNATAVNAAISVSSGMAHFIESPLSINCRVVPEKTEKTIEVPCTTLDKALAEYGVNRVDILKIDTEGHERAVLSGATATLPRVARIVVELHGDMDQEKHLIDDMLRPVGFEPLIQQGRLVYYERNPTKSGDTSRER